MPPITGDRLLFAASSAPYTVAAACALVANPVGVAVCGVYLVSQRAHLLGRQVMGLGTLYPPEAVVGTKRSQ